MKQIRRKRTLIKNIYSIVFCIALFAVGILLLSACVTQVKEPGITIEKYTVIFDTNGGSLVQNQVVERHYYVEKPDDPTKDGYVFAFWAYKRSDIDPNTPSDYEYNWQRFDFDEDGTSDRYIEQDMTLYAKYEKIAAIVNFESNAAGEFEEKVISVLYKSEWSYREPQNAKYGELPQPTRDGYKFWGWSFVQPGLVTHTVDLFARESTEIENTDEEGEIKHITLYAWWGSDVDEVESADFSLINDKVYYMTIYRGAFHLDIDIPTTYKGKSVLMSFHGGMLIVPSTANVNSFKVSSDNPFYFTNGIDGVLYNKDMTAIIAYPRFRYADRYEMPSTIKELAPWSFYSAVLYAGDGLKRTELIFNDGLERIGVGALYYASDSIRQIHLPSSVKYIGDEAFGYTSGKLNTINIPKGVEYVGRNTFVGNTDLTIYVDRPQPPKDSYGNWLVDGWHKEWASGIYGNSIIIWGSNGES
ncbi:MAG: InlB B-repeat-containing protein [Firmicutes bacterium]|nr:InlB B-repeat-containing protein [Bacillota bacterium]